jgi:membrane associated rhomboid family serine protease
MVVVLPIDPISIVAICIMIGTLIAAFLKKWMMTYALIIGNLFVFVISFVYPRVIIYDLGFSPLYLSFEFSPQLYTLFTSMFVHGGFLHIFGNMLIFFFVGVAFEQRIGWKKFLVIYLLAGVCGTLTHSLLNLDSVTILIGASGAIFGILGAFAFSYPRDEVVMPIPLGIIMVFRRIKVIYAVLLFAALETIIVMLDVQDTTAHFAHLGGLIGGVVLAALLIGKPEKDQTKPSQTIYYDSSVPRKAAKVDFSKLQQFAVTAEQKEMLQRIEKETVPQVRDIWLEHFLEKVVCPKCKKPLQHFNGKIWCDECGFKTNY